MFAFLYDKFTQNNMYQILSQSVGFSRLYTKKHFGAFFGSQCIYAQQVKLIYSKCDFFVTRQLVYRSLTQNIKSSLDKFSPSLELG